MGEKTKRGRRAVRPVPMERDDGMALLRLEHEITRWLAAQGEREACAELSAYLDRVSVDGGAISALGGAL